MAAMLALMGQVRELDLGNFAPTLPALALGAFRHRHLHTPVLIDDNPKALALARAAYTGGRTEAFRLGLIPGRVTVYDVNALYPTVMATESMPTVLRGHYRWLTVPELAAELAEHGAVAEVTLATEAADYPLVQAGRLIFPVGRFRTTLAAPELRHALARGRIVDVHQAATYEQAPLFGSYVAEWWARRAAHLAAGDSAAARFDKLMANALYGKFGQRGEVWREVGAYDPAVTGVWLDYNADTGVTTRYRAVGGALSELEREVESRESHPAIAATVTSAARLALLGLLEAAGRASVVYVDTDSLFTVGGPPGPSWAALVGPGLGQLKRVATYRRLVIFGLKDYQADGRRVTKGVRRDAVELAPGVYEQDTFVGLRGGLQAGDVGRQLVRRTTKHLARTYDKGVVAPDGRVTPYRLG